jgi:TfoX/Sxy family transcriptional regulator of competence genes
MAYDEGLGERIREVLAGTDGVSEKKMFGGLAFMVTGNMACGVIGDDMVVRGDPDDYAAWLAEPGVRVFDFTGRPMKGWIVVGAEALDGDDALERWVARGRDYAASLPPK